MSIQAEGEAEAGEPAAAPGWRGGLSLLRERDFPRLFAARMVSAFGTSMAYVALPFAVLDLVGPENPEPVGHVIAAASAAQLLFQIFGGALADRGSRQRMMVGADALAMSAQGAIAALILTGTATVPLLVGLSAFMGIAFALHWPASVGLVPLVVDRDRLQPANALLSVANSTALGLGAAVGGIVCATAGAGWALGIDALTFLAAAVLVASLRPRPQARREEHGEPALERPSMLRDIRDGWHEFIAHRWLWTIVAQFSLLVMGFQATYAVIGPIVSERSMGGSADWGFISAGFGAGLFGGGLLAMRVHFARPILVGVLCCFLLALLPVFLIGPSPLAVVVAGSFLAGVGIEIFSIAWNTALHTHVAPEALSRVSAYDVVGSIALAPVGIGLAGSMVATVGAPTTLEIAAAMIVVPTAIVLLVPEVRELRAVSGR